MVEFAGPDRALFKYCSNSTAEAVLHTRRLRWSRPTLFNDIFDAQVNFDVQLDADRIVATALSRLWEVAHNPADYSPKNQLGILLKFTAPMFREMGFDKFRSEVEQSLRESVAKGVATADGFKLQIRQLISMLKILCLSDDPLSRPLWGHYADSYRGAVLEFRAVEALDSPFKIARRVTYSQEAPRLVTEDEVALVLSGESDLSELSAIDRFVFVKHVDWQWEREWRLVSGLGRHPDQETEDVPFAEMELAAVLIGPRATSRFRDEVLNLVAQNYPWTAVEEVIQVTQFGLERRIIAAPRLEV